MCIYCVARQCDIISRCTWLPCVHVQVDHWLEYSLVELSQQTTTSETLARLDAVLASRVFLVGYHFSLADIAVFSSVRGQ